MAIAGKDAGTSAPDTPPDGRPGLIGTALLDARGDWELVDAELCELTGYPDDGLLAMPLSVLFNPDDLARERVRLEQLLAGGLLTYRSEARLLHADGHALWVQLDAAAVVYGSGAPRCLVQLQDIGARKRLDINGTSWPLAAPELEHKSAIVACKDLDGRYLRVNAAFEGLFSVDGGRLRGRTDEYLFPQTVAAGLRARDAEAVAAGGERVEHSESIPLAKGDRSLTSVRFALLGAGGRPFGVCQVSADRSHRKDATAHAERLLELEQGARQAAAQARAALLEAESEARARAGLARETLLARAAGERPVVVETPFPYEEERNEHHRLVQFERAARAELDGLGGALREEREARAAVEADRSAADADREGLRSELNRLMGALEGESADRAEADAEVERLRRALVERTREVEAERAPKGEMEAELEHLRSELRTRQRALDEERAARAAAEAEADRLRDAEQAAGRRVPLPALAPEPAAAVENGDGAMGAWHADGQARLTWALAEASATYEGARGALAVMGETLGWAAGGCYSADDPSGVLRCCAFWQAPGSAAEELETVSWGASFGPGTDLVGRVLESGGAEWVEDLSVAQGFGRTRAATAGGMRSMVVVPIVSRDEILGVIELFCAERRERDERVLELLTTVGLQLGQFFMRSEAESLRSRYGLIHR